MTQRVLVNLVLCAVVGVFNGAAGAMWVMAQANPAPVQVTVLAWH